VARPRPGPARLPVPEPPAPATPSLGGAPLPHGLRARMEGALGHDFRHVRIHRDPPAARLVSRLGASAVTRGSRVFLGPRVSLSAAPGAGGILAHELVHVMQHDAGRVPPGRAPLPSDHPLEREALRTVGEASAPRVAESMRKGAFRGALIHAPPAPSPPALLRHDYTDEELVVILRDELGLRGPGGGALRAAHLTGAGLREAPPRGLTPSEIRVAVATLRSAGSGVRRGWNGNQDDLGWPSPSNPRGRYATPLHYGLALSRLAVAAGSPGATESERSGAYGHFALRIAIRARLAGAPMRIHPRAVYFVAAAQLEMDRTSGAPQGSHYLSPPALSGAARDLQRRVRRLQRRITPRSPRRGRRRGGAASAPPGERPATGLEELTEILDDALELAEAARGFRAVNRARRATGHSEELDEPMVDWILGPDPGDDSAPAAVLAGWATSPPPANAAEMATRVDALQVLLAGAPGRAHGMGALDAHGTHHAMGLAIDYGTAGRSSAENRGVPRGYWDFLHHLMDRWAPDGGRGEWEPRRPRAIHEMGSQARDLSGILQARGAAAFEAITGEPLERDGGARAPAAGAGSPAGSREEGSAATSEADAGPSPPSGAEARALRQAHRVRIRSARGQLRAAQRTLRLLLARRSALHRLEPDVRHEILRSLAEREAAVRGDIRSANTYSPGDLEDRIRAHQADLAGVQAELRPVYASLEPPNPRLHHHPPAGGPTPGSGAAQPRTGAGSIGRPGPAPASWRSAPGPSRWTPQWSREPWIPRRRPSGNPMPWRVYADPSGSEASGGGSAMRSGTACTRSRRSTSWGPARCGPTPPGPRRRGGNRASTGRTTGTSPRRRSSRVRRPTERPYSGTAGAAPPVTSP
jgi:hypothetical protein